MLNLVVDVTTVPVVTAIRLCAPFVSKFIVMTVVPPLVVCV